ncbi:MAG: Na/Pi cotransporter family protein [Eubacteriales bacterium]|nr:Na/Pi cotransporter family protein [Eubacteriales bacterium]
MSINDVSNLFMFVGGLGMFLFGMKSMSSGVQKTAGGKMQELLGILTNNRLVAVLVGAALTAIVQSSGATSVMVIGFVNAGMMTLGQAVGVIMGANIGTCITAWIVSLGQLGDTFKAFSPSLYAPLLLGIGALFASFSKTTKKQIYGEILLGLGLLFIGLDFMGDAAQSYMHLPIISNTFLLFGSSPLLGIAIGMIVTAIMQSSSASVGVLQTLAASSGAVSVSAAVYISLGANIGSCLPAVLSGAGAKRDAKRVAAMHLMYNVFGAVFFGILGMILFRLTPSFANGSISSPEIAMFHTGFKIAVTLILFPLANYMVKLSGVFVKEKPEDVVTEEEMEEDAVMLRHLDRRILRSPDFAVENALKEVVHMGEVTYENLAKVCRCVLGNERELLPKIFSTERSINKMEELITEYLVEIDNLSLTAKQHDIVKNLFYAISDIERVGDHAENIAEILQSKQNGEPVIFSEDALTEMAEIMGLVKEGYGCSINAIAESNVDVATLVGKYEEKVDDLEEELRDKHIERLSKQLCKPTNGVAFLDILSNLERISDHAYNLAGYVISEHE